MQLDLFTDPPTPMNPNRNPVAPDCFQNYKQYSDWLGLARAAKQECTICEDCQPDYQVEMKMQARCHHEWYSIQIVMKGRSIQPRPRQPSKVTKEIQHDKLYWSFFQTLSDSGPSDESSSSHSDQDNSTNPHADHP